MKVPGDSAIELAENLFKQGNPVRTIAAQTGLTRYQVEGLFFPDRITRRRERMAKYRIGKSWASVNLGQIKQSKTVPAEVFEERERAYSMPQNILGDPPLGRSALERRASHD